LTVFLGAIFLITFFGGDAFFVTFFLAAAVLALELGFLLEEDFNFFVAIKLRLGNLTNAEETIQL